MILMCDFNAWLDMNYLVGFYSYMISVLLNFDTHFYSLPILNTNMSTINETYKWNL